MMAGKNVLVTGGCGFLGKYLVKDLLEKDSDARVRVTDLVRSKEGLPEYMQGPRVELALGKDVRSYMDMRESFDDVDLVYHLAGLVSFWRKDKKRLHEINVGGTENVIKCALEAGVDKHVHVSSVAALGYDGGYYARSGVAVDEKHKFDWHWAENLKKDYMMSKRRADLKVHQAVDEKGLPGVIAYPGLMLGPGDLNNSIKLIGAINDGKVPFNMPGGTNVLDVRDVSRGLVGMAEKGRVGEGYLLSGHNLSFSEMNEEISNALGVEAPRKTIPMCLSPLFHFIGGLEIFEGRGLLGKLQVPIPADSVDSSFKFRYFDNSKARRELGWEPEIEFGKTIEDSVEWARAEGVL